MLKDSGTELSKMGLAGSEQLMRLNGSSKTFSTASDKPSLAPGLNDTQISKASSVKKDERKADTVAKKSRGKQRRPTVAVHAAGADGAKLEARAARVAQKPPHAVKDANHPSKEKPAVSARSKASLGGMQCSTSAGGSKPAAAAESAADSVTTAESVTAAARGAEDLDDIFASLAPKRAQRDAELAALAAEEARAERRERARAEKKRRRVVDPVFGEEYDIDRAIDPQNAKVHRHDSQTGLRVYKAHDLGLGRGGDTPLCPFDCKCCF